MHEKDRFEYALRVLRPYPASGQKAAEVREADSPPPILKKGFELADQEYDRLLSTIDPKYYHEFAVPAHLEIDDEIAGTLLSSLRMRRTYPGVIGPENVRHHGKIYKVWIQTFPCG